MNEKKVGFLFPGQGSQEVGMGRTLAESDPAAAALFRQADEILGYELSKLCFDGPLEELSRADRAQPAIFLVSAGAYRAVREKCAGLVPAVAGGLSSGEWAALYAAGVVSFEDALQILQARGRFMQEACEATRGGMSSIIGLAPEAVEQVCRQYGVYAANFNTPAQTVISGEIDRLPAAEEAARQAGARKVVRLNVAGAFHSPLMRQAGEKLAEFLAGFDFHPPQFPVVSNVTGRPHGDDPEKIKELMVEQVYSPVKWVDCMRWMVTTGAEMFLECGPGRVMSGLARGIDKSLRVLNISDQSSLERATMELKQGA